jgi:deferrochelatase/peroxidase EfeB
VLTGAVALGVGAGLGHALAGGDDRAGGAVARAAAPISFHGAHQAGIATPAQEYLNFAVFDLTARSRVRLRALLQSWSEAAAALASGRPYAAASTTQPDPGEAIGLDAAGLTLTFGLGPGLFTDGRLGLSADAPAELQPLPPFSGERLQPGRSGGDLCVQACANDPQVAFHAMHLMQRLAADSARLRWSQLGFGRTSNTSRNQETLRNLMGFKDGTDNIHGEDLAQMSRFVWVGERDGPKWMAGGSYLVARRISILFDRWDATTVAEQERTIGRHKLSGAPLGGREEYDPPDLGAREPDGSFTIPEDAHIRIAAPSSNEGLRILRRGYSYSEATQAAGAGSLDAGLFFIAFQRSPLRQFVPLQNRLAGFDALNRHTLHTASAIFACPPGAEKGGYVGATLLD